MGEHRDVARHVRLAAACQATALLTWLLLLWCVVLPEHAPVSSAVSLPAVTIAAALSCWARALCSSQDRAVWAFMATGLTGYAFGFVILFGVSTGEAGGPFGLNYSDCASLLLYPAGYTALVLLTRSRVRTWRSSALLDGALVALASSAVAVTWAAASYPSLLAGSPLNVVYALAYVVGGATLLVIALTGWAMSGWQLDATWTLVLLGWAVMTVGDAVYGVQSAAGTFAFGTPVDAMYTAGPLLVSLAAWRFPRRVRVRRGGAAVGMVVPAVATLVALVLLVIDHSTRIPTVAIGLAAAAIVVAVGRTGFHLRQERQLVQSRRDAETDELTGLPNRRALLSMLRARLSANWADVDLMLLDLDGFKEVNDTLGHASGDRLLVEIAERLRAGAGAGVARLGGDEFAVVLAVSDGDPVHRARRLRELVEGALLIDGCQVSVSASIGLAGAGADPRPERLTPEELLRRGDVALYRAKALGNGVETWSAALDVGARDRLELLAELRLALASDDQFVAHYQPQVHPGTRQVVAVEALVRWQHPRRGLLAPGAFLSAVEQAGLLPQLTLRVLGLVLQHQAQALRSAPPPPVSVNVGAPDLLRPDFAAQVARLLADHAVPANRLRIEVTEGVVMSDPDRILATLHELQTLGVTLSLDDYGTGLSSLSYLRSLPIDELKIDRSFVQRLTSDPATALIVSSTIHLAHGLGLRVVAEGVEDEQTLHALVDAGCDLVQGYLLGRPAPAVLPAPVPAPRRRDPLLTASVR